MREMLGELKKRTQNCFGKTSHPKKCLVWTGDVADGLLGIFVLYSSAAGRLHTERDSF